MSFFGWAMLFLGLGLLALGAIALIVLSLWRRLKGLGREAAAAGETLSRLGTDARSLGAHD
ncbi:MAG: hypothetical protein ACRDV3_00950 [Acidothermaceae bacterium]